MANILIADTDPILRNGLKFYLTIALNMQVIEADSEESVLAGLRRERVDLVILDSSVLEAHGYDLITHIKSQSPGTPIMLMGSGVETHQSVLAIRAGVTGYLSTGSRTEDLSDCIYKLLEGGIYISPEVAEGLAQEFQDTDSKTLPHKELTNREYEIFILLVSGKRSKQIADQLHLSIKTVSTHRRNILKKMALQNNSDLVIYAITNDLI